MDNRFSSKEMGIPIISTRGLFFSKPYQPHYLLPTSSERNDIERIESFPVLKNHGT